MTRSAVPGYLASAAAFTLSAVAPVTGVPKRGPPCGPPGGIWPDRAPGGKPRAPPCIAALGVAALELELLLAISQAPKATTIAAAVVLAMILMSLLDMR